MAKIEIHRLTNANIYADGNSLLGKAEEINLPEVKHKFADHKALGMVGTFETWAGIDKLEGKIKWSALYPDVLKKTANPFQHVELQLRGSMNVITSAGLSEQKKVVALMTVAFKNFPAGNYKQHDNVEVESTYACYYMKVSIGTEDLIEVDVLNNIYKAGGVDMLAQYRANIGG